MDMESDMCDGDMDRPGISRPLMIIQPSLNRIAKKIYGGSKERSGKK